MARLTGPDEAYRVVYLRDGRARARGHRTTLCIDQACTVPADILTLDGDPIPGATVTVDEFSRLPVVQYPDGVRVLYTTVAGGPVVPLYANTDTRLEALIAQVGSVTLPASVMSADENLADLTDAVQARTNLGLGSAATLAVGTGAGSVAAGDDSRIVAVASKVNKGDLRFNVKDYGVVGNFTTDDTAAIQAIIDTVVPVTGGTIFFPQGNYRITAPLLVKNKVTIEGSGELTSLIRTTTTDIDMIRIIGTSGSRSGPVHMRNIGLIGPGKAAGTTGNGITVEWGSTNFSFAGMYLDGMRGNGMSLFETYTVTLRDVFITNCGENGFYGKKNCNHILWSRCNFLLSGGAGLRVESGTCGTIHACDFESNSGSGIELLYTNNYLVQGCEIENNGATGSQAGIYLHYGTNGLSEKAVATTITGCGITGTNNAQYGIRVDGANLTHIIGNQILYNQHSHINVTANASRTLIGLNSYVNNSGLGTPTAGSIVNVSSTTGVLDVDTTSGLPRTLGMKFEPGPTPTVASGGQVWYSDASDKIRHRNALGTVVRDVCSGVVGQVAFDTVTIPANGTLDGTGAVSGASAGQKVVVASPLTLPAGVMIYGFVSAANTVTVRLHNTTGSPISYTGTHLVQAIF